MQNALSGAASPYLRQHQNNPVDWVEWGDEAFAKAKSENKLVLVSVGYAACHWCHVMAHESFENESIAAVMNQHFVCIKVDREERPDVDQIYLEAVQLMTGRGGWPLNCFILPDGKPLYGGTYFRPDQWKDLLERLAHVWANDPTAVTKQAEQITAHLRKEETRSGEGTTSPISWPEVYAAFASRFDRKLGGRGSAPKFPMPCEWRFLLRYGIYARDENALTQVRLTLDKMAAGGICDQLGGGFARYSTDSEWKVPHFEKMLYDNAQLLELYAEASLAFKNSAYRETAMGIAEFLERELAAPGGGYCSALDADSEGEEGLYYIWTRDVLENILGDRMNWFTGFCDVDGEGLWEHGRNILLRHHSLESLARQQNWTLDVAKREWESARQDLLATREKRERPLLDDKVLTSWNGLLLKGFSSAFRFTGEMVLRERAILLADFLLENALRPDGGLWHRGAPVSVAEPWRGNFAIEGFLEDYAFLAEGLIELYQCTFTERYLDAARALVVYALNHFADTNSPLLYFTADNVPPVLVRKKEVMDNVIPSSNAAFARVLLHLADYDLNDRYRKQAEAMLSTIRSELPVYASAYAYWAETCFMEDIPSATFAVVGDETKLFLNEANKHYAPHLRLAGCELDTELSLLKGKFQSGKTWAYRCEAGTCGLPSEKWKELLQDEAR